MRHVGDPPVDRVVHPLLDPRSPEELDEIVADLFRAKSAAGARLSKRAGDPIARVLQRPLPDWADAQAIDEAHEFFAIHGLTAYLILATASLPATYVDESIAEVLSLSGELVHSVPKRLGETSRMVLDVMEAGGLASASPLSQGIETALRVRLLHSTMRYLITVEPAKRASPALSARLRPYVELEWRQPQAPINQVDLIATMLTFSYIILKGWRTTGVPCDEKTERSYIHTWNVIGHVMGIRLEPDQYPATYDQAEQLFESCLQSVSPRDAQRSIVLAQRLADFVSEIGGALGRPLFPLLTHRVLGTERAERLKVRHPTGLAGLYARALLVLVRFFSNKLAWLYTSFPLLSTTFGLGRFSRRILERFSDDDVLQIGEAVRRRRRLRTR